MQRTLGFAAVCSILAMHTPLPAESIDSANGQADQLFKLLKELDENTPFYTTKRSFQGNVKASAGETLQCVKAVKTFANDTDAQTCTQYKTDNLGNRFLCTYSKMDGTQIKVSLPGPSTTTLTVLFVDPDDKCFIIEITGMAPKTGNAKACDMVSTSLTSSGEKCETEFKTKCGSDLQQISTEDGCSSVPTPACS